MPARVRISCTFSVAKPTSLPLSIIAAGAPTSVTTVRRARGWAPAPGATRTVASRARHSVLMAPAAPAQARGLMADRRADIVVLPFDRRRHALAVHGAQG